MSISKIFLTTFSISLLLLSCNSEPQYEELSDKDQVISDEIKEIFDHTEIIFNEDTILIDKEFKLFYENQQYSPLWYKEGQLTATGDHLISILMNAHEHGLPYHLYKGKEIRKKTQEDKALSDVMLTFYYSIFLEHHHFGILDSSHQKIKFARFQHEFKEFIQSISDDNTSSSSYHKISSQNGGYQIDSLVKKWILYSNGNFYSQDSLIRPMSFKEDSIQAYQIAKNNLQTLGFLDSTELQNDSLFLLKLKLYQNLHGLKSDGLIGKHTQDILSKNHYQRYQQYILAIEKWKWKKDSLPETYVYVNIPEYRLYYYRNDSLKAIHKVIVGAPATKTPEFSASMTTIVTYPYWHVPHSIASTEIVALAKKDPQNVQKKGYIIENLSKEVISPDSVQWSKYHENYFPFRVKQEKGRTNSLGILKFLFPNEHMVYIHDTPGKWLFRNDVRAYSHGCIRLENPIDFAKTLIEDQEFKNFNGDSLQVRLDSSFQKVISLRKSKPVIIDYITTTIDPKSDSLQFLIDIYGRDKKYIERIFGH